MKKIIVLNLKMNLDYDEAQQYVELVKNKISDKHEIIIAPSFLFFEVFKKSGYKLCAQNVHYLDRGALTGEISPLQLKTLGVSHVIIGHSERRLNFNEDNKIINNKVKGALRNNLNVILCIGETIEERSLKKTAIILKRQLINGLKGIDEEALEDVTIAYEPVWAIGSGKTPTNDEIEDAIKFIIKTTKNEYNITPKIIYGGSVNKENIKNIISINNIDGVLIGGASVNPKGMLSMIKLID